jgi:hypothetical protein
MYYGTRTSVDAIGRRQINSTTMHQRVDPPRHPQWRHVRSGIPRTGCYMGKVPVRPGTVIGGGQGSRETSLTRLQRDSSGAVDRSTAIDPRTRTSHPQHDTPHGNCSTNPQPAPIGFLTQNGGSIRRLATQWATALTTHHGSACTSYPTIHRGERIPGEQIAKPRYATRIPER